MIISWRRRKAGRKAENKKQFCNLDMDVGEIAIPTHFRFPISLDLMKDPVTLPMGITYDRSGIEKWIETGNNTCPVTNQELISFDQIPNHALRRMIQDWCVENRSYGIERIPTPRIPVIPYEVSRIRERVMGAVRRLDEKKCKESEQNKKCMTENGIGGCLSAVFESFAGNSADKYVEILVEILTVLPWMFPLSEEDQSKLGSSVCLRSFKSFLEDKDLTARQNAVLVLRKLISLDQKYVDAFGEIEGGVEAIFGIIGEPICPQATKAALACVLFMISSLSSAETSDKYRSRFVELGLVSLLLETLVDAEKSVSETSLRVLDGLCDCKQGREKALENALTMPLLVKKILRISELGTEFSVSINWKLCTIETQESFLIEALQVGAFQKLLVLLQVGFCDGMKGKVTDLLKLFNLHISKLDYVDSSMNFK
ncbi:unnamed protein product [Malus baccata var. baccata]